jgi:hypothetical protein
MTGIVAGERQLIATAISNGRFKAISWAVWPSSRDPQLPIAGTE